MIFPLGLPPDAQQRALGPDPTVNFAAWASYSPGCSPCSALRPCPAPRSPRQTAAGEVVWCFDIRAIIYYLFSGDNLSLSRDVAISGPAVIFELMRQGAAKRGYAAEPPHPADVVAESVMSDLRRCAVGPSSRLLTPAPGYAPRVRVPEAQLF